MAPRRLRSVMACLALIIGLGGCVEPRTPASSPPIVSPTPPVAPVATPTPVPSGPQTNPTDREDVAEGGILKIAVPGFPQSWNPWATSAYDLSLVEDVLTPRLFTTAADGTLRWDPAWLASEPRVTLAESPSDDPPGGQSGASEEEGVDPDATDVPPGSPDLTDPPSDSAPGSPDPPMTVTYTLHPQAQWNDTEPMTAADFVATWQACAAESGPACRDRGFEAVSSVAEGTSPSEVVVTYDRVYSDWAHTFARGPFRAAMVTDPTQRHEIYDSPVELRAGQAGPYVLISFDRTRAVLGRNPMWWGQYPKLDSLWVVAAESEDFVLSYLRGDLDGMWVSDVTGGDSGPPDSNVVSQGANLEDLQVRRHVGPVSRYLLLNSAAEGLTSANVRRAIFDGLDRQWLAASDQAGLGTPQTLDALLWTSGEPGYDTARETTETATETDPGEVLDKAGWLLGEDGLREREGTALALDFLVPVEDRVGENEGFGVRAQLAAIGVKVNLVYVDADEFESRMETGAYAMMSQTYRHTTPLGSAARFTQQRSWGAGSLARDYMLLTATGQLDEDARAQTLERLETSVRRQGSVLPLYEVPEILLIRSTLANYGPDHLATTVWEDVGWVA